MSNCANPECRNGSVPGLRASGGGTGNGARPLYGVGGTHNSPRMQWSIVPCPACRPQPKGPAYVPIARTEEEIEERWQLANSHAVYKPDKRDPRPADDSLDDSNLQAVRDRTAAPKAATRPASITINAQDAAERVALALERLVARIEILTGAVLGFIEEQAHPMVEVSDEEPEPDEKKLALNHLMRCTLGNGCSDYNHEILHRLLGLDKLAPRPTVTETGGCSATAKERSTVGTGTKKPSGLSRAKTKGGSVRKRGGTAAESTE